MGEILTISDANRFVAGNRRAAFGGTGTTVAQKAFIAEQVPIGQLGYGPTPILTQVLVRVGVIPFALLLMALGAGTFWLWNDSEMGGCDCDGRKRGGERSNRGLGAGSGGPSLQLHRR